jgi:hypothetical protein
LRDDTRRESAVLRRETFLPTVEKIAHLMLAREVEDIEEDNGGGEAQ